MEIVKKAICGSLESSDVLITISPNDKKGINLDLNSIVLTTFGNSIKKTIHEILEEYKIKNINIIINDRGAADFAIRARLKGAIHRASQEKYDWSKEDKHV